MAGFEVRAALKKLNERVAALEAGQEDVVNRAQMYANQAAAHEGKIETLLGQIQALVKPNSYPGDKISGG